jgi:hypothetical protein
METYTDIEKEKIGKVLIEILMLRKDTRNRGRYLTSWGNKTPLGIFNTFQRLSEEININRSLWSA